MSAKKLNGVAHNIAHHAASGLSCLHPYLGEGCRALGITLVTLDLLNGTYPIKFPVPRPLRLSTQAILTKFRKMVDDSDSKIDEIESAVLHFQFLPFRTNDYSCDVKSVIKLVSGKELIHIIN